MDILAATLLILTILGAAFFVLLVFGLCAQAAKHKKNIRELQGLIVKHDRSISYLKREVRTLNDKTKGATSAIVFSSNPNYQ
jgi:hypothetical protein